MQTVSQQQSHSVKKGGKGASNNQWESILELRKVFLINEARKSHASFNNGQRYFINLDSIQLKNLLLNNGGVPFKI